MSPVKLTLTADGDVHRLAERGIVTVTVKSSGQSRKAIADAVENTAKEIQAVVRPLAKRDESGSATDETAIMRWSSSGMIMRTWTEDYYEYYDPKDRSRSGDSDNPFQAASLNNARHHNIVNPDEVSNEEQENSNKKRKLLQRLKNRRLFEATVEVTARFCDFQKLSAFVVDMSSVENVTVGPVKWVLTEETLAALQTETVKKAYGNVFVKAKAYADAMGLTTIRPMQIDEPSAQYGYGGFQRGGGLFAQAPQMQQQASAPLQQSMSVIPQDVFYSATCTVIFELE